MNIALFFEDIHTIAANSARQAAALETIARFCNPITGIEVERKATMAKLTANFKKSAKPARAFKAGDPVGTFTITDDPNKPGNFVVHATNLAGDILDVSAVATIGVTADASGNATFQTTGAVSFAAQGVKQGQATATITLTWTDGSVGPFTGDVLFNVNPGGPTGLVVTPA